MPTPSRKPRKVTYEKESLFRWNLCQKISKALHKSHLTTIEIEAHFDALVDQLESQLEEELS